MWMRVSLVFAFLLTAAAPAGAATASRPPGTTITFIAANTEVNDLTVSPGTMPVTGSPALVFDDVVPVTPGAGCVASGDNAICPRDLATTVAITLGDQPDEVQFDATYPTNLPVTVNGDAGSDGLFGSPSADTLNG